MKIITLNKFEIPGYFTKYIFEIVYFELKTTDFFNYFTWFIVYLHTILKALTYLISMY